MTNFIFWISEEFLVFFLKFSGYETLGDCVHARETSSVPSCPPLPPLEYVRLLHGLPWFHCIALTAEDPCGHRVFCLQFLVLEWRTEWQPRVKQTQCMLGEPRGSVRGSATAGLESAAPLWPGLRTETFRSQISSSSPPRPETEVLLLPWEETNPRVRITELCQKGRSETFRRGAFTPCLVITWHKLPCILAA